jgi:hypothetical protein
MFMKALFLFSFFLLSFSAYGQIVVDSTAWERVIITRNTDDVVGLKRIQQLRVVLINIDEFAMSPINIINMVGVAYR